MIALRACELGTSFAVRVQPRAGRSGIAGILGEGKDAALKVALNAPPIDGRANEELVRLLAKVLGVPRHTVEIIGGSQSRNKVVCVRGITAAQISLRFEPTLTG